MKHTPGPWEMVKGPCGNIHFQGYKSIKSGPGFSIFKDEGNDQAQVVALFTWSEANARLIAAAPDLLEAAKEVLVYLHHPEGQAPNGFRLITAMETLTKAVAKAEGAND